MAAALATGTAVAAIVSAFAAPALGNVVVTVPPAPTSTTLVVTPSSGPAHQDVALTATVASTRHAATVPVGTCTFRDAGARLAVVPTDAAARCRLTTASLRPGKHAFTAAFTPADPRRFEPSRSPAVSATYTSAPPGRPQTPGPPTSPGPRFTPPGPRPAAAVGATIDGRPLPAAPTLAAGDVVTLVVRGFTPGEAVALTLASTPRSLGAVTAAPDGTVTYRFTVPADLEPGPHALTFRGSVSGVTQVFPFTVGASARSAGGLPTLPRTGTAVTLVLGTGALLLTAGACLSAVGRKRTRAR